MDPYLELSDLLKISLPSCEIDYLSAMLGTMKFKIDETTFAITTNKTHYLLVSTDGVVESIKLIQPVLEKFMGDNQPFCSYEMVYPSGERLITVEWNIHDTENRIRLLVNDKAYATASVEKIELYDRDLAEYTSSESRQAFLEAEAKRIENARIFGKDPGFLDPEQVTALSEVELWLNIDSIGYMIWRLQHDALHGRIEKVDTKEHQYSIEFLVYTACKKLGIEISEPKVDNHVSPSSEYRKWYDFYATYFRKVLSEKRWHEFNIAREKGDDISNFLPLGDWRSCKMQ